MPSHTSARKKQRFGVKMKKLKELFSVGFEFPPIEFIIYTYFQFSVGFITSYLTFN